MGSPPLCNLSLRFAIFSGLLIAGSWSIPIPNGQIGKAEVECGEDTIEVVFITDDDFLGRIFVVGHSNETECVSRDKADPPGLFVTTKIMLSFHDEFITKVDRGYEISCFYMEADKTVTYPITVSGASLSPFTELAEMPRCRYEVVDPKSKEPLDVVTVGSKLLHTWTCDSTAPDLWCMQVHSCFVEDGSGTQFMILDDEGCSIDRFLLDNLEYGPGKLHAQKEAHAFKFADKDNIVLTVIVDHFSVVVNFQCSVRLTIKDDECPIPACADPAKTQKQTRQSARGRGRNFFKRDIGPQEGSMREVDVRAQQLDVLDPQIDIDPSTLRSRRSCITPDDLLLPASLTLSLILSMLGVIVLLVRRPELSKNVN